MQCPNCRKTEKGQWLYSNGSRPYTEINMEDWVPDEDLYDHSHSEMVRKSYKAIYIIIAFVIFLESYLKRYCAFSH